MAEPAAGLAQHSTAGLATRPAAERPNPRQLTQASAGLVGLAPPVWRWGLLELASQELTDPESALQGSSLQEPVHSQSLGLIRPDWDCPELVGLGLWRLESVLSGPGL